MIYILMIWTTVAATTVPGSSITVQRDWRPLGEFYHHGDGTKSAKQMCEDAAKELGLKIENFRCVRSK